MISFLASIEFSPVVPVNIPHHLWVVHTEGSVMATYVACDDVITLVHQVWVIRSVSSVDVKTTTFCMQGLSNPLVFRPECHRMVYNSFGCAATNPVASA